MSISTVEPSRWEIAVDKSTKIEKIIELLHHSDRDSISALRFLGSDTVATWKLLRAEKDAPLLAFSVRRDVDSVLKEKTNRSV